MVNVEIKTAKVFSVIYNSITHPFHFHLNRNYMVINNEDKIPEMTQLSSHESFMISTKTYSTT